MFNILSFLDNFIDSLFKGNNFLEYFLGQSLNSGYIFKVVVQSFE